MRSQLDVRLGVQVPQVLHLPPDVHSLDAAVEAIELANAYGICDGNPLSEAQEFTLRAGLGEREDGSWAAATVADFKPRQGGGKSDTINARELAGLVLFGERLIIHTAHEFSTANESFLRLVAIFENYDDLRKKVARIRYANGEQGIEFLSGQRLKYRARTGGAGRGFTKADLVVYDEAQHLMVEHVAASGPARLANPNSQSWYAGSGGLTSSAQAWALRKRALSGNAGRLAYTEQTAEVVSLDAKGRVVSIRPDVDDRDAWVRAIPGLGQWVTEEGVGDLFVELGEEKGARELLCVWDPEPPTEDAFTWEVISEDAWHACLVEPSETWMKPTRWALDVSPDARSAAIAASDGLGVEVIDHRSGIAWVVTRAVQLHHKYGFEALVMDATGPGSLLLDDLAEAGVPVQKVTLDEHAQGCAQFLASVEAGECHHIGQEPLDEAVRAAKRRTVVDRWLWTRTKSDGDISPLVAAGLARFSAGQYAEPEEPDPTPAFTNLADYLEEED